MKSHLERRKSIKRVVNELAVNYRYFKRAIVNNFWPGFPIILGLGIIINGVIWLCVNL